MSIDGLLVVASFVIFTLGAATGWMVSYHISENFSVERYDEAFHAGIVYERMRRESLNPVASSKAHVAGNSSELSRQRT